MFIQTESTPNPLAIKFICEQEVTKKQVHFASKDEAKGTKLALNLFDIEGVDAVFFGTDFITITKTEHCKWEILKPLIIATIMDHFTAGYEGLEGYSAKSTDSSELTSIEKQIVEIIETKIRPSVAMDGGDIIYKGFKEGIVYLELQGACAGCPSSEITLKNGIESMLQYYVPEVIAVEAV